MIKPIGGIISPSTPLIFAPVGQEMIISFFLTNILEVGEMAKVKVILLDINNNVVSYPIITSLKPEETQTIDTKLPVDSLHRLRIETNYGQVSVTLGIGGL